MDTPDSHSIERPKTGTEEPSVPLLKAKGVFPRSARQTSHPRPIPQPNIDIRVWVSLGPVMAYSSWEGINTC